MPMLHAQPRLVIPGEIAGRLRDGELVDDADFDSLYPPTLRAMSTIHWTPVEVACRVVDLLAPAVGELMLDIGSGVGKVCHVGALRSTACWQGIELRSRLNNAARAAAHVLGVSDRTRFVQQDAATIDWHHADGVYMFNPFGELRMDPDAASLAPVGPLAGDRSRRARLARYRTLVDAASENAWRLRLGARLVTFHGFGGSWPRCLELIDRIPMGTDFLELWVRVGSTHQAPRVRSSLVS